MSLLDNIKYATLAEWDKPSSSYVRRIRNQIFRKEEEINRIEWEREEEELIEWEREHLYNK